MLNRSSRRSLSFLYRCITMFKLVPFTWNTKLFHMEKDKTWKFYIWVGFVIVEIGHSSFLTARLFESWLEAPISILAVQSLWNLIFILSLLLHLAGYLAMDEIPLFINSWFQMELNSCNLSRQFERRKQKNPFIFVIFVFVPLGLFHLICCGLLYLMHPTHPQFLYSLTKFKKSNWPMILAMFSLEAIPVLPLWGSILFYDLTFQGFCFSMKTWLRAVRYDDYDSCSTNGRVNPDIAVKMYRNIYLLMKQFNTAYRFLVPSHMVIITFIQVVTIFVSIHLYNELTGLGFIIFPFTALVVMVHFFITFPTAGSMYSGSLEFLASWKRLSGKGNLLMRKTLAGFPPQCSSCDFFFLDRMFTPHFFSLIAQYVINALLTN